MSDLRLPICPDSRKCFGQMDCGGVKGCTILTAHKRAIRDGKKITYDYSLCYAHDGECPFCKPEREVTNGEYYPLNKEYGKGEEDDGERMAE